LGRTRREGARGLLGWLVLSPFVAAATKVFCLIIEFYFMLFSIFCIILHIKKLKAIIYDKME
jgi:hypothetical protein